MSYNPYSYPAHGANERFARDPYVPLQGAGTQTSQSVPEVQGMQGAHRYPDPGSSMAYQLGQTAFTNFIGQQNFSQFQEVSKATTSSLSHYFQVTTDYVLRKLKLILLPFYNKNTWQRLPGSQLQGPGSISFLPPKDDVNSPDLYIPIMGLVTYILIWNVQRGLEGSFNPENLYYKLSSTLAFVVLDLVILKLGLYLLVNTSSPTASFTELVCYVGYKFIPLTLVLLFPSKPWALSLIIKIYLFIAFGVFLLRSVKFNLFNASNDDMGSVKKSTVKKCNYFLFVYGFLWQSILMWLMG
ncbi:YIF1 (YNL263C) [Zygosaccharomyces parabailii]|nr:YIF1 (YNL263C) [Zygosaccharomyces parabailii]CDH09757.1 related to Protein transport protein YIF1 [Zygosaccharomyces bailii ISA1307]